MSLQKPFKSSINIAPTSGQNINPPLKYIQMNNFQATAGYTFPIPPPKTELSTNSAAASPATARFRLLFEKELTKTDVDLNRIYIPKKSAEEHLPKLEYKDVAFTDVEDMDGTHVWKLQFRFWLNRVSRMYLLGKTRKLIDAHGLERGYSIALYQDIEKMSYVIHARKAGQAADVPAIASVDEAANVPATVEAAIASADEAQGAVREYEGSMSFIYDTTNFPHDSPFNFFN